MPAGALRYGLLPQDRAVYNLPHGVGSLHAHGAANCLSHAAILREVPSLPHGAGLPAGLRTRMSAMLPSDAGMLQLEIQVACLVCRPVKFEQLLRTIIRGLTPA